MCTSPGPSSACCSVDRRYPGRQLLLEGGTSLSAEDGDKGWYPPWLVFNSLKPLHTMLPHWKLCLDKGTAKIRGRAFNCHPQITPAGSFVLSCSTLVHKDLVPCGLLCPLTHLHSALAGLSCPCAHWSLTCGFWLYGPCCVSYHGPSVPPVRVDAAPKITLRLAGLVRSRCAGSVVCLAVEKGMFWLRSPWSVSLPASALHDINGSLNLRAGV